MKKRILLIVCLTMLGLVMVFGFVTADDGPIMIRNVSKTPDTETEEAGIAMMNFYVPAQASNGDMTTITYTYYIDEEEIETEEKYRGYAKPLLTFFIDGIPEPEEETFGINAIDSGLGLGERDSFVALSLDDGVTWKRMNVSNHAANHWSSFDLPDGTPYPADSYAGVVAAEGDRVMAAWLSRFCDGGIPAYTWLEDDGVTKVYSDHWGVAGSQGSVDYTLNFPEIGEVPYGCVWTSRGQLLFDDGLEEGDGEGFYDIKPERLTSGRRDPNRLEIAAVEGAGFAIVWQEDPNGLRPGTGLGPGEGWSGAIVNAKTDIWYSMVGWDAFDQVYDVLTDANNVPYTDTVSLAEYAGEEAPKVSSPMALPVRVTDNDMCQLAGALADVPDYCFTDFGDLSVEPYDYDTVYPLLVPDISAPEMWDTMTFCSDYVVWQPDPSLPKIQEVCVTGDDRILMGRVGASRPRITMHPYTNTLGEKSAWVLLGYEETKALGEGTSDIVTTTIDIGKNMWYHSFDMSHPDIINHGNILNQPAMFPFAEEGEDPFFELKDSADAGLPYEGKIDETASYSYTFYETEITRRFSLISQDIDDRGASGVVAFALVKQGIINQGGPADIFGRAFKTPVGFDPTFHNPYAFENMVCENWDFKDGSNPFYPEGICLDTPPNISGTEVLECEIEPCPTLEEIYVWDDTLEEYIWVMEDFYRVTKWDQVDGLVTPTLGTQSWHNPFDISKGHRGFLDGDFLMVLYAWSPNYKQNAVGHDHYNLYIRRSFDGGVTWTTTPADYGGDGTKTCEQFGWETTGGYIQASWILAIPPPRMKLKSAW